mgnify:FL=1
MVRHFWRWVAGGGVLVLIGMALTAVPESAVPPLPPRTAVVIRGETFRVELAANPAARERGLMGREHLGPDEGLLFVFETPERHAFWMKGMLIPVDIVWIAGDTVVGVVERAVPEGDLPDSARTLYFPPVPVDRVLEIAAGRAQEAGIRVGDGVTAIIE